MEEFKFRGFNEKNGWIYGYLLVNKGVCFICPEGLIGQVVDPDSVAPFTGCYSASEKEIFVGDLVQIEGSNTIYAVVFYEGAYGLATEKQLDDLNNGMHPFRNDYARLRNLGDFEIQGLVHIVGNCYESSHKC